MRRARRHLGPDRCWPRIARVIPARRPCRARCPPPRHPRRGGIPPPLARASPPRLAATNLVGLDALDLLAVGWASAWSGWPIFHPPPPGSLAAFGQAAACASAAPSVVAGIAYAPGHVPARAADRRHPPGARGRSPRCGNRLLARRHHPRRLGIPAAWASPARPSPSRCSCAPCAARCSLTVLTGPGVRPDPPGLVGGALAALGAGLLLALGALAAEQVAVSRRLRTTLGPFLVYFAVAARPRSSSACACPDRPLNPSAPPTPTWRRRSRSMRLS